MKIQMEEQADREGQQGSSEQAPYILEGAPEDITAMDTILQEAKEAVEIHMQRGLPVQVEGLAAQAGTVLHMARMVAPAMSSLHGKEP